jgi:hypothetical protein
MNLNEECLLDYLSCLLGKPKTAPQKGVVPVVVQHTDNTAESSELSHLAGELGQKQHHKQVNELIKKSLQ